MESGEATQISDLPATPGDVLARLLPSLLEKREPNAVALISRAAHYAADSHADQKRASGEPYISHTLEVARIVHKLNMDHEAVAAAILHDVVEDTPRTLRDIDDEFGPAVARLVDGVTKMGQISGSADAFSGRENMEAESLRKMLLATAEDVRVVMIKLADRLHNLRTLKYLEPHRQRRIARETLDIYAPLANRLGVWQLKWELEDLSFRYLDPGTYKEIARLLDRRRVDRESYMSQVVSQLQDELETLGIKGEVSGRPKHIYSIWRKMDRKNVDFNQIFDVRAVRVLVPEVADCYAVLGVVHSLWRHIPKEFDDYVASPKENLYRSLHTAVVGPEGQTLEVQIRTFEMHQHAEYGIAAHWRYKEGSTVSVPADQQTEWLKQLLEWEGEEHTAKDFVDRFKSEAFDDRVYVLTPQGQVMNLPAGSTPLDFAYYVHTDVGHRCRGAKVNGRIVPLTYSLKSGDQVEILTTRQGRPSRDWLNPNLGYLNAPRARAKVRQWFKHQDYEMNVSSGRAALERELGRLGIHGLAYEDIAARLGVDQVDDMFAAIGRGDITMGKIAAIASEATRPEPEERTPVSAPSKAVRPREASESDLQVHGVGNLLTQMARCCSPVPGDEIVGYITRGRGVTIHRRDCANILRLNTENRERLIQVDWGSGGSKTYPVEIKVLAYDRSGLLADISAILVSDRVNVIGMNTYTDPDTHIANMIFTLEITNMQQLSRVLDRISQLPNIHEVRRNI